MNPYYKPYYGFKDEPKYRHHIYGRRNKYKDDEDEDELNPYEVLNVSPFATFSDIRFAYMKLATFPLRSVRRKACLAYDMICNKDKYYKIGNKYRPKVKDCFYYTIVGDLYSLQNSIEKNKNLLYIKDNLQRSLLYLSARNGYFNLTEYLLKKGLNINDIQSTGSTALHGAAYYGQELIIQLLIEHGINTKIRNNFGATAADEAKTPRIRELILQSDQDRIMNLYQYLFQRNLAVKIIPIKKKNVIIAQKILCPSGLNQNKFTQISKNWCPAWHGTKFENLESIIKYGLHPSGSKLPNGVQININEGHIPLDYELSGIKQWGMAVFVSPSLFYACNYAERINSCLKRWCILVETRVRPNSFTMHPSTVLNYAKVSGEPYHLEFRVDVKNDKNSIYRVTSQQNIFVINITFVLVDFLENISNYNEGNITINSQEERMLLDY